MRRYLIGILFGCTVLTTGCSVTTPMGTARITFDKEETAAANTVRVGNKEFDVSSLNPKDMTDKLLDNVVLPAGTDTDQLKQFVYDNLEQLGISLDSMEFDQDTVTDVISSALESAGAEMESE